MRKSVIKFAAVALQVVPLLIGSGTVFYTGPSTADATALVIPVPAPQMLQLS